MQYPDLNIVHDYVFQEFVLAAHHGCRCVSTPIQTRWHDHTRVINHQHPRYTTAQLRDVNKYKLLRKEVIQPHLPVRLPCYDFVPIADPTFDSSLTSLGNWLRVLPTFLTLRAVCTRPGNVFTAALLICDY